MRWRKLCARWSSVSRCLPSKNINNYKYTFKEIYQCECMVGKAGKAATSEHNVDPIRQETKTQYFSIITHYNWNNMIKHVLDWLFAWNCADTDRWHSYLYRRPAQHLRATQRASNHSEALLCHYKTQAHVAKLDLCCCCAPSSWLRNSALIVYFRSKDTTPLYYTHFEPSSTL